MLHRLHKSVFACLLLPITVGAFIGCADNGDSSATVDEGSGESLSVTSVGINTPEIARERTLDLIGRLAPCCVKVKLGGPEGVDADKAIFEAVLSAAPHGIALRQPLVSGTLRFDAGAADCSTSRCNR